MHNYDVLFRNCKCVKWWRKNWCPTWLGCASSAFQPFSVCNEYGFFLVNTPLTTNVISKALIFFSQGFQRNIHRFWLWIRQQEEVRQVAVGDGSVNPPSLLPLQSKTTFVWRCHPFHCYKMFCHITIYFNTPLTTYALFAKHSPFVTWGFQWNIPTFSPLSCPWMWQAETLLFLHLWTCLQIQVKLIHAPKP